MGQRWRCDIEWATAFSSISSRPSKSVTRKQKLLGEHAGYPLLTAAPCSLPVRSPALSSRAGHGQSGQTLSRLLCGWEARTPCCAPCLERRACPCPVPESRRGLGARDPACQTRRMVHMGRLCNQGCYKCVTRHHAVSRHGDQGRLRCAVSRAAVKRCIAAVLPGTRAVHAVLGGPCVSHAPARFCGGMNPRSNGWSG